MSEKQKREYICDICGQAVEAVQSPQGWILTEDHLRICKACKDPRDVRYYRYSAVLETRNPESNYPELQRQVAAVQTLYNMRVEIERRRRSRCRVYQSEVSAKVRAFDAQVLPLNEQLDAIYAGIMARRVVERKTNVATDAEREQITVLKKARATLYNRRKTVANALFKDPQHMPTFAGFDAAAEQEKAVAKAEAGLLWDTMAILERRTASHKTGAPPEFKAFSAATIGVQIQKGMSPAELFSRSLDSGRAKLEDTGTHYRRLRNKKVRLWIRVGSNADGTPIWASVMMVMHRSLPEHSLIKAIHLRCFLVGNQPRWAVLFSVEQAPRESRHIGGRVAIDIGWRMLPDGDLRVAYWVGSDGREGEIKIPALWLTREPKSKSLYGFRSKHLDRIKFRLRDWLLRHAELVPEWLAEQTRELPRWRSCERLRRVVKAWEANPIVGGERMLLFLQAWLRKDQHLYIWAVCNSRKYRNLRMNLYRHAAKRLAGEYETLVLEKVDWAKMSKKPPIESKDKDELARARVAKLATSPSVLEQIFREAFVSKTVVPCENMSWIHATCGQPCGERDRGRLHYRCTQDGIVFDQDRNACLNMLRVAGGGELRRAV